jgi:hypothetical protein
MSGSIGTGNPCCLANEMDGADDNKGTTMQELYDAPNEAVQLPIYGGYLDRHQYFGHTLTIIDGRLWFAMSKYLRPSNVARFTVRLGWNRHIPCTIRIVRVAGFDRSTFVYVGEILEIAPSDRMEISAMLHALPIGGPHIKALAASQN